MTQAEGMFWNYRKQLDRDGQDITYRRGTTSATLKAILGHQLMQVAGRNGMEVRWTDQDFLFLASDFSAFVEPELGDEIDLVRGSETFTYEVGVSGADDFFRYCDPHHLAIRVHSKHRATA